MSATKPIASADMQQAQRTDQTRTGVDAKCDPDLQAKRQEHKSRSERTHIPNRETFQRMNFLHQAATHLTVNRCTRNLGRYYASIMKRVASKNLLRMYVQIDLHAALLCHLFAI